MHSPQRMQRARKLFSSSAPGGRIRRGSLAAANPGPVRRIGNSAAPAATPVSARRRCKLGRSIRGGRGGEELEADSTFRALAHAVEAEVAFRFAPLGLGLRIVPSLAIQQAAIAVVAMVGELLQAQNRPARNDSQQRAQGAQRPAPEARDAQVEHEEGDENRSQEKRLAIVRLPEAEQGFIQDELGNVADGPQRRGR